MPRFVKHNDGKKPRKRRGRLSSKARRDLNRWWKVNQELYGSPPKRVPKR